MGSKLFIVILCILWVGCKGTVRDNVSKPPEGMVYIPSGEFIMGSSREERDYAYQFSSYWKKLRIFDKYELDSKRVSLKGYFIDRNLVTQKDYQDFVKETNHPVPFVDKETWDSYKLIHKYPIAKRYLWKRDPPRYPKGRRNHPVVLVSHDDALSYCKWRSQKGGREYRLGTEAEWEKAARGTKGYYYPWGNLYDGDRLNNFDKGEGKKKGPFDTVAVGSYPMGQSPYGLNDMAGMVFEWTSTKWRSGQYIVKGGSWDDDPGWCRSATRHGRPEGIKHVLIGFRCVSDIQ